MSDRTGSPHDESTAAGHGHGAHGDPDPEIRARVLTQIMVVLAVVTVAFAALVWPLSKAFFRAQPPPERAVERIDRSRPAGPLLQVNPTAELERLRSQEQRALESYGWVDRGAGVARGPVERALELVLEEGVGALASGSPDAAAATVAPAAGGEVP